MPKHKIILFCICLLCVFVGQTPVALTLMTKLEVSNIFVSGGMVFSIIAGVLAIGIFLSEAQQLGGEWVDKADLALKAAGGLLALVVTFWFGLLQHQQEKNAKEQEENAKRDAQKVLEVKLANEKAQAAQAAQAQNLLAGKQEKERLRAENAIRFRELLPHLASADAYLRLQAVTNVGELISEQDSYDLTASQALFTASRHDTDDRVKNAALQFLPDGINKVAETTNFATAVIELATTKATADWQYEHKLYLALVSLKDSASNADTQKTAGNLIAQLSANKIKDATKAVADVTAAVTAVKPDAQTVADTTAKLDNLAPAVIYALASTTGPRDGNVPALFPGNTAADTTKQIQQAIQNTSQDAIAIAIKNLPSAVAQKLSARVYFQIADEKQRAQAKKVQGALGNAGYICPGIQNVKGHADIPDTLEVRYFVIESKGEAEKILQLLKENGAKDGRVSYVIPTASDLRISPDIKSHFEVWSGQSSF